MQKYLNIQIGTEEGCGKKKVGTRRTMHKTTWFKPELQILSVFLLSSYCLFDVILCYFYIYIWEDHQKDGAKAGTSSESLL